MATFKKAGNIIINVLLWILIVIIAFFALATLMTKEDGKVSNIGGYSLLTVLSDSMKPEFSKKDLIIIHKEDAESFKEGEIISFWTVIDGKQSINTHRIAQRIETGEGDARMVQYVTQGDNNNGTVDPYIVSTGDIIGKYMFAIPGLGAVLAFLSTGIGFFVVVVLPLLAFFIYQLCRLIGLLMQLKRATIIEATQEAMKMAAQNEPEGAAVSAGGEPDDGEPKQQ